MSEVPKSMRVNQGTLGANAAQPVRLVGKVVQQANGTAVVETSDVRLFQTVVYLTA